MTPRKADRYDISKPKLDVGMHDALTGHLGESGPDVWYRYDNSIIANDDGNPLSANAVSVRLPVVPQTYGHSESLAFFDNLLLESDTRSELARADHLDDDDVSGLLGQIGAECAGAVSLRPHGTPTPAAHTYRKITEQEIESLFDDRHGERLTQAIRESQQVMSGVQRKLVLRLHEDSWYLPLNGAPSTHIIKRSSGRYDGLVANELACLRLLSACDLPVADAASLGQATKWNDNAIEPRLIAVLRYDRQLRAAPTTIDTLPRVTRLHQEDLCQVTGRRPTAKYQANGGPTFRDLATAIRRYTVTPAFTLENTIKAAIANICVGNGDAHGKNFSLLTNASGDHQLAPFYDIVSTDVYPSLTATFSMRFGYAERATELSMRDIARVASDFSVGNVLVRQAIDHVTTAISESLDNILHSVEQSVGVEAPVLTRIRTLTMERIRLIRRIAVR